LLGITTPGEISSSINTKSRKLVPIRRKPLSYIPPITASTAVSIPEMCQDQQDHYKQTVQYQWWVQHPQAGTQSHLMWSIDQSWEELHEFSTCISARFNIGLLFYFKSYDRPVVFMKTFDAVLKVQQPPRTSYYYEHGEGGWVCEGERVGGGVGGELQCS
jgi:hypothetical protein